MVHGCQWKGWCHTSWKPPSLGGKFGGGLVFIPRIPVVPSDSNLPFPFERLQFPVKTELCDNYKQSSGTVSKGPGPQARWARVLPWPPALCGMFKSGISWQPLPAAVRRIDTESSASRDPEINTTMVAWDSLQCVTVVIKKWFFHKKSIRDENTSIFWISKMCRLNLK